MPYIIQGESPPLPRDPVELNGTTYVPLRDITETLGGCVEWSEDDKTSCATIAHWSAVVPLGSDSGDVNGTRVTFSGPLLNQDGTIWVPADFFHNAFGYHVEVQGNRVSITNPVANAAT